MFKPYNALLKTLIGQAKMAVYLSRKRTVENSLNFEAQLLSTRLEKSRMKGDVRQYK